MDKPEEGSEKGISRRPEEERKRERLEKREKLLYIEADYEVMGNTVPFDIKKKPSQEPLFCLRKTVQEALYP